MKNVFCITNDYGDVTPRAQLMESYLLMSSNFNKNNACEVREIGGDYTAVSSSTPQSRVSIKCIQKRRREILILRGKIKTFPTALRVARIAPPTSAIEQRERQARTEERIALYL